MNLKEAKELRINIDTQLLKDYHLKAINLIKIKVYIGINTFCFPLFLHCQLIIFGDSFSILIYLSYRVPLEYWTVILGYMLWF